MSNPFIKPFAILLFGFLISLSGFAQSFTVDGDVTDAVTGEVLPGAAVIVNNSSAGVVTDKNGHFEINGLKDQNVTLEFRFISYENKSIACSFSNSPFQHVFVELKPTREQLEEVTVTGSTDGQVKAMLEQRTAVNIKNVVSSEQIAQFPDLNAAEVMQRIPGITVQRDQGEGKYVQLRGTPPELTNFNINGEQVSSPEGDVRYVGMDIISADQIEYVEVTKVLTPDMDADGIAGNVNIITKKAKDEKPQITTSVAAGYNNLMKTGNHQMQFGYGQRFKKLGMQLNASYYQNNQGSHNMEFDYTRGPTLRQAQSGVEELGAENFHLLYTDIEYRLYTIKRERTGLSANLDYMFNEDNFLYLRAMYNKFSDDELRRRKQHKLSDANEPLIYRSTNLELDVRSRVKIQEISTVNLGGENKLGSFAKFDYEGSYSLATDELPKYINVGFDQGNIGLEVDKSDPEWPMIHYTNEEDAQNAENYGSYEFDGLTFRDNSVKDETYAAKTNITLSYNAMGSGHFKFGGKVRFKNKERNNRTQVYSKYEKQSIYSQPAPPLALAGLSDGFVESNLLNHNYELTMTPNAEKMNNFFEANMQHFKIDEAETWEDNYQEDYHAEENIYAVYGMFRHDFNRLMVLAGVRYEQTEVNYTTQNAWLELEVDSLKGLLQKSKTTAKRTIPFWLPQIQLKYTVNQKTNIRAAFTYTYSRPSFEDILPYRIEDEDGDIKKGNPTLNFPTSLNFDLLAETYLKDNGIVSGGVYYKIIDDFVFKYVRRAHEGENFNRYGLREITMPVNGQEAYVFGAEMQTQFKFNHLQGQLRNLGFFGTYTFTESKAYISRRYPQNENDIVYKFDDYNSEFFTGTGETEVIPLPGQAKHTANAALFYDSDKFYIKLSANYHSPFLVELGNDSSLDVYYDEILHLDFNASYQFTEYLKVFIDMINLTDAPLRYYIGSKEYFKQIEYYSWWGRIGVKLKF